ncbi:LytTR family DNA-binding domain-containing protein [Limosilactobacillus reuteri]|uniref:LytR/AlgR family response regulator transcription factor n=1 Tax=Limosilactobacillus reuteri TaxID=1598 RepID=UPI0035120EFF
MDYHLLVCDDDRTQAKNIATLLKMSSIILEEQDIHPTIDLIATDAESVLDYLEFNSDLNNIIAFLDIQLDENSNSKGGLDLAQKIKTLSEKAQIIFITTHEELAIRKLNEFNYIKKNTFSYKVGTRIINVNFSNILYISTTKFPHKLKIVTSNGQGEFSGDIKTIEQNYPLFFKASQSSLINLQNVETINTKKRLIKFSNNDCLNYSRSRAKELNNLYKSSQ